MAVAAMGMAVSGIFGYLYCDVLKLTSPIDQKIGFYLTRVFPIGLVQVCVLD